MAGRGPCIALQPPPGQLARLADRVVPLRVFVLHQMKLLFPASLWRL
jgi:hypothetical protein